MSKYTRGRPISKDDMYRAMKVTSSNKSAARYLGVSYQWYRQFARMYLDKDTNRSLWDIHKNQAGRGVPKFLKGSKTSPAIKEILDGKASAEPFSPEKLKLRIISDGYLQDECSRCGFNERRVIDYKVPLILNFKSGKKTDWRLPNLELLCYNCYFLFVGNVFTNKQIQALEDHVNIPSGEVKWDIDEYQLRKLAEIEKETPDENDGSEFIAFIKR